MGVDAKKLNCCGNCLLHALNYMYNDNTENILLITKLLINTIPELINTLNIDGETPLDIAMRLSRLDNNKDFIALLKKHGAKTAAQLKQDEHIAPQKTENNNCIICLESSSDMLTVPCPNVHSERLCIECYDSALKYSQNCPICRTPLS